MTDSESQTISFVYDDAGQKTIQQFADHTVGAVTGDAGYGRVVSHYDALGRLRATEDQQGDTITMNFDMSGRMLTRSYVGHPTSPLAGQTDTDTFTFDRAGRLTGGHKGRYNNSVTLSYDDRGQLIQETLTAHGQSFAIGYVKNVLGQNIQLEYPDGSLVDCDYTDSGRLLSVDYTAIAGASTDVADFAYDPGGRETIRNLGNGLTTTHSYFGDNQIQTISTEAVEDLTYSYDANKNPISETRNGVMSQHTWSTGSDGIDKEDRLVNWICNSGKSRSWDLSPMRNWNSVTTDGQTLVRTHGNGHEIISVSEGASSSTLEYDNKGNMTLDDRGVRMEWDADNRIVSLNANGVIGLRDSSFAYDAFHRRVSTSHNSSGTMSTTLTVHAGKQPISSVTLNQPQQLVNLIYGASLACLAEASGPSAELRFRDSDRTGALMAATDHTGNIVQFYTTGPYGVLSTHASNGIEISGVERTERMLALPGFICEGEFCDSLQLVSDHRSYLPHLGLFLSPEEGTTGRYSAARGGTVAKSKKCRAELMCTNLIFGVQHCGIETIDGSGRKYFHVVSPGAGILSQDTCDVKDTGPDRINTPIGVGPWQNNGTWVDPSGSLCDCIKETANQIRRLQLPYFPTPDNRVRNGDEGCESITQCNSNYTTRCIMNKCGIANDPVMPTPGWNYRQRECLYFKSWYSYHASCKVKKCRCTVWSVTRDDDWCGGPSTPTIKPQPTKPPGIWNPVAPPF